MVVLVALAATIFTLSGVFQIVRVWHTGSARDVSFWYTALTVVAIAATWGIVMLSDNSLFIRIERAINLVSATVVLIVVIVYKLKDRKLLNKE